MKPRRMPSFDIAHRKDQSNDNLEAVDPDSSFEIGKMFFLQTVENVQNTIVKQILKRK